MTGFLQKLKEQQRARTYPERYFEENPELLADVKSALAAGFQKSVIFRLLSDQKALGDDGPAYVGNKAQFYAWCSQFQLRADS